VRARPGGALLLSLPPIVSRDGVLVLKRVLPPDGPVAQDWREALAEVCGSNPIWGLRGSCDGTLSGLIEHIRREEGDDPLHGVLDLP